MKLSFSTDYWEGLSWADYVALAKEMQFSGIEIHDIEDPVFKENGAIFSDVASAEASTSVFLVVSTTPPPARTNSTDNSATEPITAEPMM